MVESSRTFFPLIPVFSLEEKEKFFAL